MRALLSSSRHGVILIIVAGISALLASMSLVFLSRMRSDVIESQAMIREAQARIMLSAACSYIQEASRLGYDTFDQRRSLMPVNFHPEAYGWIDVRDGSIGPKVSAIPATDDANVFLHTTNLPGAITPLPQVKTFTYRGDDPQHFPIGSSRRVEMYMKEVPPFAIRLDAAPNPINPTDGYPYLSRPDPMPVLPRGKWDWSNPSPVDFSEFERGDPRPITSSLGLSWFRLHRCGPGHPNAHYANYNAATFIVTVGAGGTGGFRFYGKPPGRPAEMTSADEQRFMNAAHFGALQAEEIRQWYLVEWSPAVGGQYLFNIIHHRPTKVDANGEDFAITQYAQFPQNYKRYTHSQGKLKNFGGTIRLVQRLLKEPPEW